MDDSKWSRAFRFDHLSANGGHSTGLIQSWTDLEHNGGRAIVRRRGIPALYWPASRILKLRHSALAWHTIAHCARRRRGARTPRTNCVIWNWSD